MTEKELLTCATEALDAHGNTEKARNWYKKYIPNNYTEWGLGTTTQYSLSCFLMEKASKFIKAGGVEWPVSKSFGNFERVW